MADLKAIKAATPVAADPPLCVDLDGTLVKSDTLIDSLLVLARSHPAAFFHTPLWAWKGKAFLKGQVGSAIALDVAHLPYNRALLDYLHSEVASGPQTLPYNWGGCSFGPADCGTPRPL